MTNAVDELALWIAMQAKVPAMWWGPPGVGKSAFVEAMAKAMGIPIEVVVISHLEPSEVNGFIAPDLERRAAIRLLPDWHLRLKQRGGILLLDEYALARPEVQGASLVMLRDRKVGGDEMHPDTMIVLASNRPGPNTASWHLSSPAANRLVHLNRLIDGAAIAEAMILGYPAPNYQPLPEGWRGRVPVYSAYVGNFLRRKPELAHSEPTTRVEAGGPWPSPRTWDYCATLLAAAEAGGFPPAHDVSFTLASGTVGPAAGELIEWLRRDDLPDPDIILRDPGGVEMPERSDMLAASLDSVVAAALSPHPKKKERYVAAWEYVTRVFHKSGDIAVWPAQTLARNLPAGVDIPKQAATFARLLSAAGIRAA